MPQLINITNIMRKMTAIYLVVQKTDGCMVINETHISYVVQTVGTKNLLSKYFQFQILKTDI
jgi:hypothetical protein